MGKWYKKELISQMKDNFQKNIPINKVIHSWMLELFKKYICIGGMPEVIDIYLRTSDMNQVLDKQRQICLDYESDFGTHLNDDNQIELDESVYARILDCFHSIPSQLAKKNKKFQYSLVKKNGSSREYKDAIEWLEDAGIISRCYNLSNLELPLSINKIDSIFKIYMQDTGLFVSMLEPGTAGDILSGNLGTHKGAIFENIIADAFSKMDRSLYYFHKDSGLEIDFITRYKGEVTLIEVKAKGGKTKSSRTILEDYEKYKVKKCIKLSENNIGYSNNILTIPYYLAFLINEY